MPQALAGFGDAADLKSPWFTGHSRGVAGLARAAAGLASPAGATAACRAGLLHDLGRVAVPAGVWIAAFLEAIGTTGPVTEFTPLAYAGNDQGDVTVFIRYAFTVTATGKHAAMNIHHRWKFRHGKACYVRSSEDTAQVTAALTP